MPMADRRTERREGRRQARRIRDAIPAAERARFSREICTRARRLLAASGTTGTVMVYLSFRREVDTEGLIDALRPSHRLAAPRLEANGETMQARLLADQPLVRAAFGMLEPPASAPVVEPASIDAVLVPGLAFDANGFRLGYGGGYYDGFLPRCPQALRIGLAFEAQLVDSVDPHAWDEPLHHIVTERRVISVDRP